MPVLTAPAKVESWKPASVKLLKESVRRAFKESALGGIIGAGKDASDWDVVILEEGPGNLSHRHWYTREALMKAGPVFEGVKAFLNHPSAIEQQVQPERRVEDVLGYYHEVGAIEGPNGRMQLRAKLRFVNAESDVARHVQALMKESLGYASRYPGSKPLIGISINADGEDAEAEINGERWNAVTSFTEATSADVVTFPAAGGKFMGLLESARSARRSGNHKEAGMNYGKMAAEIEGLHKKAAETEDAEAKAKLHDEARVLAAAMRAAGESDEADAAETKKAAEAKQAEEEAMKKANGGDDKAPPPAPSLDDDGTSNESLSVKVRELRESATALTAAGKTDLAAQMEKQAKALETKTGAVQAALAEARKQRIRADYTESVLRAQRIVKEAGLPVNVLAERALWGKTEAEQKEIVADRKGLYESITGEMERRGLVESGGERAPALHRKSEDVTATLTESGVPVKKPK